MHARLKLLFIIRRFQLPPRVVIKKNINNVHILKFGKNHSRDGKKQKLFNIIVCNFFYILLTILRDFAHLCCTIFLIVLNDIYFTIVFFLPTRPSEKWNTISIGGRFYQLISLLQQNEVWLTYLAIIKLDRQMMIMWRENWQRWKKCMYTMFVFFNIGAPLTCEWVGCRSILSAHIFSI